MVKTVAVVGAGASGLAAIKCCIDEGLEPVCFERSEDIGGLWRFTNIPEDGRASIYKSVIINTSKEMMCFSDFPIPEDFPNYMHNAKIMEYFYMYAEKFSLMKFIQFKTNVCSIRKNLDFPSNGQWIVTTEKEGKQNTNIFDAILICSGHHTIPHLPLTCFPGIEMFKGQYIHSRDYKTPDDFRDKRILVVGIGNSGVDIAVELSWMAKQVFLSTRRGAWILNRVSNNGYPVDIIYFCRYLYFADKVLPSCFINYITERIVNERFDHGNFGLLPKHRFYSQHPTVNDELPNRIISGRVKIKSNVKKFRKSDVVFEDGTVEKDIDVVIFATGYSFTFPFCDESVLSVTDNNISLYKNIFPLCLNKNTMAVIGLIQPLGAIMPVSEQQARLATRVFKGLVKLPSAQTMIADVELKKQKIANRYVMSQRHTIQVDYVEYMDELATMFGVKPNLLHLFVTDPKLWFKVLFGPCTPYQYRLMGPGKWNGARTTILTQQERIIKPTKTRTTYVKEPGISFLNIIIVCAVLTLFVAVFLNL